MIYSTLSHVSDLAKIGYIRAPGMLLNLTAITLGGELARRTASVVAGSLFTNTVGRIVPMDKIDTWSKEDGRVQNFGRTVYKYSGLETAIDYTTRLRNSENKDLAVGFAACLIWSAVHMESVNFILGKPHWGYNQVLKYISCFEISATTPAQVVWGAAKANGIIS
jgi:hypothetical protein